jgi:hypothetical protein
MAKPKYSVRMDETKEQLNEVLGIDKKRCIEIGDLIISTKDEAMISRAIGKIVSQMKSGEELYFALYMLGDFRKFVTSNATIMEMKLEISELRSKSRRNSVNYFLRAIFYCFFSIFLLVDIFYMVNSLIK